MKLEGPAVRLTIFIGEDDHWHHKPLYTEIVHRAHKAGLAGASVLRGIEGYGASSRIHTSRILSLSDDLPLAIIIVDAEDKIRAFLPQLDELVAEGLVIIDPVEVIRYVGRPARHHEPGPPRRRCASTAWTPTPCTGCKPTSSRPNSNSATACARPPKARANATSC
jgi:PII-like signaling protein